jgi:hypothetical protein
MKIKYLISGHFKKGNSTMMTFYGPCEAPVTSGDSTCGERGVSTISSSLVTPLRCSEHAVNTFTG